MLLSSPVLTKFHHQQQNRTAIRFSGSNLSKTSAFEGRGTRRQIEVQLKSFTTLCLAFCLSSVLDVRNGADKVESKIHCNYRSYPGYNRYDRKKAFFWDIWRRRGVSGNSINNSYIGWIFNGEKLSRCYYYYVLGMDHWTPNKHLEIKVLSSVSQSILMRRGILQS